MLGGLCASVSLVVPLVRQLVCARRATRWAAPRRGVAVSHGRSSQSKSQIARGKSRPSCRGWLVVDPRVSAPGAALSPCGTVCSVAGCVDEPFQQVAPGSAWPTLAHLERPAPNRRSDLSGRGQEGGSGAHWMVFCAAPPPREPTPQRRKPVRYLSDIKKCSFMRWRLCARLSAAAGAK